jgi:hypothetical protein
MSLFACTRREEVANALRHGHWPDGCVEELRNHVVACRACSDLVLVTQSFQAARTHADGMPRLESPGVLWWRAQLRRRYAAMESIDRPILGAQLFAFAVIVAVGAIALVWQVREGRHELGSWLEGLSGAFHFDSLLPVSLWHTDGSLWILVPVLATIALLSGVVVYLASEKH